MIGNILTVSVKKMKKIDSKQYRLKSLLNLIMQIHLMNQKLIVALVAALF